jgi:GNAT superfamily N-acetyltransferase
MGSRCCAAGATKSIEERIFETPQVFQSRMYRQRGESFSVRALTGFFIGQDMECDVRITAIGTQQRDLLIEMYDRFEPMGAALGLPPLGDDVRREWVEAALAQEFSIAALSPAGATVGHCFLVAGPKQSAELAVFVRQEFRRRGVATALVKAMLEWACIWGLRRVWALTGSENRVALRLLARFGFRQMSSACGAEELEMHLPGYAQLAEIACDHPPTSRLTV